MGDFEKRDFVYNILIENLNKDSFDDNIIEIIEEKIPFIFQDIPTKDLKKVINKFIKLLNYYDFYKKDSVGYMIGKFIPNLFKPIKNGKPSLRIKDYIKRIEAYQQFIEDMYRIGGAKGGGFFLLNSETSRQMTSIYELNKLLIEDLKNGKFELLPKSRLYPEPPKSKTELKLFFKTITKKYNLKNVSDDITILINSI